MKGSSVSKAVVLGFLVVALVIAGSVWRLGSKLTGPANHAVPLPAGFQAQISSERSALRRLTARILRGDDTMQAATHRFATVRLSSASSSGHQDTIAGE
jgi:hypothetical protein